MQFISENIFHVLTGCKLPVCVRGKNEWNSKWIDFLAVVSLGHIHLCWYCICEGISLCNTVINVISVLLHHHLNLTALSPLCFVILSLRPEGMLWGVTGCSLIKHWAKVSTRKLDFWKSVIWWGILMFWCSEFFVFICKCVYILFGLNFSTYFQYDEVGGISPHFEPFYWDNIFCFVFRLNWFVGVPSLGSGSVSKWYGGLLV